MLTTERRLTWTYVLSVDLSPTFLNTGIIDETFQQSGKQSSANMSESSSSKFFRTITGIQSGPDAFDKSRFMMTFLTSLGVAEMLCSFRFVIEGKTSKETPEN